MFQDTLWRSQRHSEHQSACQHCHTTKMMLVESPSPYCKPNVSHQGYREKRRKIHFRDENHSEAEQKIYRYNNMHFCALSIDICISQKQWCHCITGSGKSLVYQASKTWKSWLLFGTVQGCRFCSAQQSWNSKSRNLTQKVGSPTVTIRTLCESSLTLFWYYWTNEGSFFALFLGHNTLLVLVLSQMLEQYFC